MNLLEMGYLKHLKQLIEVSNGVCTYIGALSECFMITIGDVLQYA